jgi:hypothetical protein
MAIRQVRKVPNDLPAAHLFLDDIEEIASVLEKLPGYRQDITSKCTYQVDDRMCDTIADLKKIGGKTRNFSVSVKGGSVSISTGSRFYNFGLSDSEDAWQAFARIRDVFERRSSIRTKARNLPSAVLFTLYFALPFAPVVFFNLLKHRPYIFYIWWAVYFPLGYLFGSTHSIVELRYFDEARNERSKELRPLIWTATISFLAGCLGTVLAERIVKWLWP